VAFRKAGNIAKNDNVADANSFRLERKLGVRERIEYLTRQAQERIAEKRAALEEQLWAVLEGDIGDFWETYEAAKTSKDGKLETDQDGKMLTVRKQRAKLINDMPPEFRKLIEDVTVDRNGNVIPKLYSKAQANRDLREMLNIDGRKEQEADDVSRLSDAELIQQLADTAKELGIEINLNYSFLQLPALVTGEASVPWLVPVTTAAPAWACAPGQQPEAETRPPLEANRR
jgi:Terminase small subunit